MHKSCSKHIFSHIKPLKQKNIFTHRQFYAIFLHRGFAHMLQIQRYFYTQRRSHTNGFTHKHLEHTHLSSKYWISFFIKEHLHANICLPNAFFTVADAFLWNSNMNTMHLSIATLNWKCCVKIPLILMWHAAIYCNKPAVIFARLDATPPCTSQERNMHHHSSKARRLPRTMGMNISQVPRRPRKIHFIFRKPFSSLGPVTQNHFTRLYRTRRNFTERHDCHTKRCCTSFPNFQDSKSNAFCSSRSKVRP